MATIHRRTIQKKNNLSKPDNHDGVITHVEPDILECEIKWALGSIITNKASGGNRIPAELFQILKDDTVKVLHSIGQQIWKTAMATGLERSVLFPVPKKGIEKGMATHSSILAWRIPCTVEPGWLQPMGSQSWTPLND